MSISCTEIVKCNICLNMYNYCDTFNYYTNKRYTFCHGCERRCESSYLKQNKLSFPEFMIECSVESDFTQNDDFE